MRSVIKMMTDTILGLAVSLWQPFHHRIHSSEVTAMRATAWQQFFQLLNQIVNLPNKTATEKATLVREKSWEYQANGDLGEFTSWFQGEDEEPGAKDPEERYEDDH